MNYGHKKFYYIDLWLDKGRKQREERSLEELGATQILIKLNFKSKFWSVVAPRLHSGQKLNSSH